MPKETCRNCRYSIKDDNKLWCRRYPPINEEVVRENPLTPGKVETAMLSKYIITNEQWWCGEWNGDDPA